MGEGDTRTHTPHRHHFLVMPEIPLKANTTMEAAGYISQDSLRFLQRLPSFREGRLAVTIRTVT